MTTCGMSLVRTFRWRFAEPIPGADQGEVLYRITRAEWSARGGPSHPSA
jgi:hypothetical protein